MYRAFIILFILGVLGREAEAGLVGSPHDFAALGGSPCGYCHSIHHSLGGTGLLTPSFGMFPQITKIYSSATRNIPISISTASTSDARICLACHDSVNVNTLAPSNPDFALVKQRLDARPTTGAYIEVDLSNDHPVGFVFDTTKDPGIKYPQTARPIFGLSRDQMWCSTCHNVHDNSNGYFLVMKNENSALCFDCHVK